MTHTGPGVLPITLSRVTTNVSKKALNGDKLASLTAYFQRQGIFSICRPFLRPNGGSAGNGFFIARCIESGRPA
jgi:hypothetical protein